MRGVGVLHGLQSEPLSLPGAGGAAQGAAAWPSSRPAAERAWGQSRARARGGGLSPCSSSRPRVIPPGFRDCCRGPAQARPTPTPSGQRGRCSSCFRGLGGPSAWEDPHPYQPSGCDFHRNFYLLGGLAGDHHRLQEAWPPGVLSPDPRLTARLCSTPRVRPPWPRDGGLRPSPMLGVGAVPQLQPGGGRAGKSGVPTLGRKASSGFGSCPRRS